MHAIVWSGTRHVGVVAARLEGKRLARPCLDCLDSLTFGLSALLAPSQFIVTKPSEEAQTGPAEYLATSAIMSRKLYSFEAQCSLPCLTKLKAACLPSRSVYVGPKFTRHHGIQSPLERLGQSSFTTALVHFQNLQVVQIVGVPCVTKI